MINLSRFSTPRWHCCKLVNMPTTKKICLILICRPKMLKICCAKKPTFGNLNSLTNHHINKLGPFTWNIQNKYSSTLKRPLVASCVEATNLNKLVEIKVNSCAGGIGLAIWLRFKKPITTFNKGSTTKLLYYYINVTTWSQLMWSMMQSMPLKCSSKIKASMLFFLIKKPRKGHNMLMPKNHFAIQTFYLQIKFTTLKSKKKNNKTCIFLPHFPHDHQSKQQWIGYKWYLTCWSNKH